MRLLYFICLAGWLISWCLYLENTLFVLVVWCHPCRLLIAAAATSGHLSPL